MPVSAVRLPFFERMWKRSRDRGRLIDVSSLTTEIRERCTELHERLTDVSQHLSDVP